MKKEVKTVNLQLDYDSTKKLHRYLIESQNHFLDSDTSDYVVTARRLIISLENILKNYEPNNE
tara:strand:+ start:593 stop:781 length:189 start_codon:yes stop_codon:yes gene_type:complete